jgi:enoyl-CoA hydratase/carnithine racemase
MTVTPAAPTAPAGHVRLAIDGHVAVLTLDRPGKLNALTGEMTAELAGYVADINAFDAVRAVVLTGSGQSALLAHCVGPSNAAVMLLTGDPVDAATALRWGLVSEVVPLDGLGARAMELAQVIASRAPIAAQTAKLNLRAAYEMSLTRAIDYERHLQTICFATADAAEGRAAFTERRAPAFRGQ